VTPATPPSSSNAAAALTIASRVDTIGTSWQQFGGVAD
jgi:hypothetical protein